MGQEIAGIDPHTYTLEGLRSLPDIDNRKTYKVKLSDYELIVGKSTLDELEMLAANLKGKIIQNINSTFSGGGVAEILSRIVPLLEQLGVDARWDIIKGSDPFYQITKKFHNALHGGRKILPRQTSLFSVKSPKRIWRK